MPFFRRPRPLVLDANIRKCINCTRRARKGFDKCHSCVFHEAKAKAQAAEAAAAGGATPPGKP